MKQIQQNARLQKIDHLVTVINEANKDSKQLFKALNGILGNKVENPLPTGTTDSQLAEDSADFLLNKIDRIREEFTNIPAYQPKQLDTPKLKKFIPVMQSQLAKIIKAMPTKTCQLDVFPTDKLKQVLEVCLPILTHIINKMVDTNQFCNECKEALVQMLIKKPMASQVKSNYRLVSSRKSYTHTIYQTLQ